VLGPDGRAIEAEQAATLEDAIDYRIGEIIVVEDVAPAVGVLVRGEEHRAAADVALVDHVVEHVGSVVAVGEVADLVDDEHVRSQINRECFVQAAVAACRR
jgi:hypothetical protein